MLKPLIILSLVCCASAWGQITPCATTPLANHSGAAMTFAFTGATAGQWLVVQGALEDSQTFTLTDNHTLFDGMSPTVSTTSANPSLAMWARQVVVPGDYTFSLSAPGSARIYGGVLGCSGAGGVDATASTTSNVTSLSLTTLHNNDLMVGLVTSQVTSSVGTGFTSAGISAFNLCVLGEYTAPPPTNTAGSNAVAITTAGYTYGFLGLAMYQATPTVIMPEFSPAPTGHNVITSSLVVTPSTMTPSAHVCTRMDGTAPTAATPGTCDSPAQTDGTVTLSTGTTVVETIGTESGYYNSGVATASYTLVAAGPDVSVTVQDTTATQVVLKYTAPDSSACSVAISESATLVPLVLDVDPTMFSNLDSRAGSVSIGLSRVFVAGTRDTQTGLDSSPHSRALQAATRHYFRVACGALQNSIGSGTFTTQTIPVGVGYGDPIPIDPANNGNYLYPTISTSSRAASIVDPHTGALLKNLTLPGDLAGGITTGMGSAGIGVMCHPTPVKASDEDKDGYHCQLWLVAASPGLYWIAPDGETRFLGVMRTDYEGGFNGQQCIGNLSATFDPTDPNIWYCVVQGVVDTTKKLVVRAVYAGHSISGDDVDLTNQTPTPGGGTPHTTFTVLTPLARELTTLLSEFDSRFATYGFGYDNNDWANGKLTFYFANSQNTFGWLAQFDPARTPAQQTTQFGNSNGCVDNPEVTGSTYTGQTGCVVASTGTFTGGQESGFRWNTLHTIDVTPASALVPMTLDQLAFSGDDYQAVLTSALSATPGTCSLAQPGGNTVSHWPDTGWTMGCSTIHVSGDPAYTGSRAGYPATIAVLPGDLISVNAGDFAHHEIMRLLDMGVDGKSWYLQRQWYYRTTDGGGTWCEGWQTAGCTNFYAYSSVGISGTVGMLPPTTYPDPNTTGTMQWWDPVAGSKVTTSASVYRDTLPQGHPADINNATYGRWTYVNGRAIAGQEPGRLSGQNCEVCLNPPSGAVMMNLPLFNGLSEGALETHPSLSVSNPPDQWTYKQVVDGRPYYGDAAAVTAAMVTNPAGQLYRIRGAAITTNYKSIPYIGYSGSRVMKEVSGPSAVLATDSSAQFQWCFAAVSGECFAGSLAGDVYFNAPGVVNQYCTYNWPLYTTPNDVCVIPLSSAVQSIVMQEITPDLLGHQLRVLTNALSGYQAESIYWNARTLPDASWLFTTFAGNPGNIMLVKIPPQVPATMNGTAYVAYPVTVPATAGAVKVRFGYDTSFDCTGRSEACVSVASTIGTPPFWYETSESGSYTGVACTGGCTVAIPAMAGKVLYFQAVVAGTPGPIQVVALGASSASTIPRSVFGRGTVVGRGVVR